jgi:hypothetical protein
MSPLRQIGAIVRAYNGEFGRGAVWREVACFALGALAFFVFIVDLVALAAVFGAGR